MPAYDFARLTSFDFEELTCDLLQAEWRVRLESFTPGRDSGIDLRGYSDTKREVIVQCKHLALLWQIHSRCFPAPIRLRQCGHR